MGEEFSRTISAEGIRNKYLKGVSQRCLSLGLMCEVREIKYPEQYIKVFALKATFREWTYPEIIAMVRDEDPFSPAFFEPIGHPSPFAEALIKLRTEEVEVFFAKKD